MIYTYLHMPLYDLIYAETLLPERLLKAQKVLSESQEQLSELINNSPGMHWSILYICVYI